MEQQQQLMQQQQQESNSTVCSDETDSPGASGFSDDTRDGIAEPIYDLISEIFDVERGFGWLRRTLITFVQITYGRTINKYAVLPIRYPRNLNPNRYLM